MWIEIDVRMSSKKKSNDANVDRDEADAIKPSTSKSKKSRKHKSKSLVVPLTVNVEDSAGSQEAGGASIKSADPDEKHATDVRRRFSFRNFGRSRSSRIKSHGDDKRNARSPSTEPTPSPGHQSAPAEMVQGQAARIPTPPPLPKKLLRKSVDGVASSWKWNAAKRFINKSRYRAPRSINVIHLKTNTA